MTSKEKKRYEELEAKNCLVDEDEIIEYYELRCEMLEEENAKLEKFIKLCLTKYVPLDSLSPAFWERKKRWLEDMSYDYYLFLCEEICDYVVKDNDKLTAKEFDLVYSFLKEVLKDDK